MASATEQKAQASRANYTIVTQVKSNRVVYFTDDPDYRPPMDGDWYYVSTYAGELPAGMTLRNCWSWRFNGGVFIDARGAREKPQKEALLDHNRAALRRILREKIDAVRQPYLPSCAMGEIARRAKLVEARAYLDKRETGGSYPMLQSVAVARKVSLDDAARLVLDKARETEAVVLDSEFVREQLACAIDDASSEAELLELRTWLLDRAYPELTQHHRFKASNTLPAKDTEPLPAVHLRHEQARLKAQLREIVNKRRAPADSQFLFDDVMLKHKAKLAQIVLERGGDKPAGIDCSVLETLAEARGVTIGEVAREVLASLEHAGQILTETEKLKDRMIGRIEAAATLSDIRSIAAELRAHERP